MGGWRETFYLSCVSRRAPPELVRFAASRRRLPRCVVAVARPGARRSHHALARAGPCCVFIGWRVSQNSADGSRPRPSVADGKLTTLSCAADRAGMQHSLPANIDRDARGGTDGEYRARSAPEPSRQFTVDRGASRGGPVVAGNRGFRDPGRDSDRYGRFPAQARGAPARHAGTARRPAGTVTPPCITGWGRAGSGFRWRGDRTWPETTVAAGRGCVRDTLPAASDNRSRLPNFPADGANIALDPLRSFARTSISRKTQHPPPPRGPGARYAFDPRRGAPTCARDARRPAVPQPVST
jgi:hypothetical protein